MIKKLFCFPCHSKTLLSSILVGAMMATPAFGADCQADRAALSKLRGLMQRKAFLEKSVKRCGTDPIITYFYAYNLDRRGKMLDALQLYQLTIVNDPAFSNAYLGMGDIYTAMGQTAKAIEAYDQGLQADPGNRRISMRLERALAKYDQKLAGGQGKQGRQGVAQRRTTPVQQPARRVITRPVQPPPARVPPRPSTVQPTRVQTVPAKVAHVVVPKTSPAPQPPATPRPVATVQAMPTPVAAVPAAVKQQPQVVVNAPSEITSVKRTAVPTASQPSATSASTQPQAKDVITLNQWGESTAETEANALNVTSNEDLAVTTGLESDMVSFIQFKTGKYNLNSGTEDLLKNVVCKSVQSENPDTHFELAGHTDDVGSDEMNLRLSQSRAQTIGALLNKTCNISWDRLKVVYYGEGQPMVPNYTPENRAANRRVEIKRVK